MSRQAALRALALLGALALLATAFPRLELRAGLGLLCDSPWLLAALLVYGLSLLLDGLGLRAALGPPGAHSLPWLVRWRLSAETFALLLPSGGLAAEALVLRTLVRRLGLEAGAALRTLAARRLLLALGHAAVIGLGLTLWGFDRQVLALLWLVLLATIAWLLRRPGRGLAAGFFFLAWLAEGSETVVMLALLGVPCDVGLVMAVDGLVGVARAAAFAVPGGLGVQEAGHLLLAELAGLPAPAAAALVLAKRGREAIFAGLGGLALLRE